MYRSAFVTTIKIQIAGWEALRAALRSDETRLHIELTALIRATRIMLHNEFSEVLP